MRRGILVFSLIAVVGAASADFTYSDFSSISGLTLNGSAHQVSNLVRLTDDGVSGQAGNMWDNSMHAVGNGFSTRFVFSCDGSGTPGADGVCFAVSSLGTSALGNPGYENAMMGLLSSVTVNFESFWDVIEFTATDGSGSTIGYNSVSFSGLHRSTPWTADITYDANTNDWNVYLDSSLVISSNFNLGSAVTLTNGTDAFVGLGAGTGAADDNNDVLSWNLQTVPEPTTMILMASGLGALVLRRRSKK